MAINIKQTDASVNGSTLILTETEESLATTPLAEVPTDTALDSIIGVKDGVPKQVALNVSGGNPVASLTYTVVASW